MALADLADRLNCQEAIPFYWRILAEEAAALGAGQPRHFAPADLAQAIETVLAEKHGAVKNLCQQPNEVIAQISELLERPLTYRPGTSEPLDSVLFNFGKAEVRKASGSAEQSLSDLALAVESADGVFGLLLTGFTDPVGSKHYNLNLGCLRARAVKAAFVAAGLRQDLVIARALGEDPAYQISPGKGGSAPGAELNRRVTIQLIFLGPGVDHEDDCVP